MHVRSVVLGRLYQVEYAMEAIGHAGTCLGILASDGIVLAAEKRNTNKLLDELSYSEKIYRLHEWVLFIQAFYCEGALQLLTIDMSAVINMC